MSNYKTDKIGNNFDDAIKRMADDILKSVSTNRREDKKKSTNN